MARASVAEKVEEVLAAEWNGAPVFGENMQSMTPDDGSAFVVVQYPFVRSRQVGLGTTGQRLFRDEGAFRVVIHVERGSGLNQGREWADEIAAIFRGRDLEGVLQTYAPSAPVTDDRNAEGSFYILSFAVPYTHDYAG